ncbi:MAG: hypothetical protein J1E63_06325 [Muribaculaceae bacterium]|nr:hypothetical protein [Muribaculaceae bacterium]
MKFWNGTLEEGLEQNLIALIARFRECPCGFGQSKIFFAIGVPSPELAMPIAEKRLKMGFLSSVSYLKATTGLSPGESHQSQNTKNQQFNYLSKTFKQHEKEQFNQQQRDLNGRNRIHRCSRC